MLVNLDNRTLLDSTRDIAGGIARFPLVKAQDRLQGRHTSNDDLLDKAFRVDYGRRGELVNLDSSALNFPANFFKTYARAEVAAAKYAALLAADRLAGRHTDEATILDWATGTTHKSKLIMLI